LEKHKEENNFSENEVLNNEEKAQIVFIIHTGKLWAILRIQ
jgi:hypothetical protein